MMNNCPCCANPLLRHARRGGVYWFCPHCWQEMPDFEALILSHQKRTKEVAWGAGSLEAIAR